MREARTALVLAGGRSRRMGVDKAWLELGGETLLTRAVRRLSGDFGRIVVVAARDQALPALASTAGPPDAGVDVVRDERPALGPLGGIWTGLRAVEAEFCAVVGCDMPFFSARLLAHMVEVAAREGVDAVAPVIGQQVQPLHAVYARALAPRIEGCLDRGEVALVTFVQGLRLRHLPEEEVAAFDPSLSCCFNINTPEDLEEARRRLGMRPEGRKP